MRTLFLAIAFLLSACATGRIANLPAQHTVAPPSGETLEAAAYQVFFGNLHSHTSYSDGSGTPDQAYRYARDTAGIDFLAVTEHNHRRIESSGGPIATHPELYADLIRTADRYNRDGVFVALYGQEFSTISSGNHSNIFLIEDVIDEERVPNGDYGALLRDWLPARADLFGHPPLMLLNHPTIRGSGDAEEYGRDDFPSRAAWIAALDAQASLINMVNGPSHRAEGGAGSPSESEYRRYLNLGLHLGPTADQDNHLENWGDAAETRTGVLASALTRGDIMEALRERRVYASEDSNLRLQVFVDGHVIGSRVTGWGAPGVGRDFPIRIVVADDDEPSASYSVQIWSDRIGGSAEASVVATSALQGDGDYTIEDLRFAGVGQYVYVRLVQEDGDRVWTAPVWFED